MDQPDEVGLNHINAIEMLPVTEQALRQENNRDSLLAQVETVECLKGEIKAMFYHSKGIRLRFWD